MGKIVILIKGDIQDVTAFAQFLSQEEAVIEVLTVARDSDNLFLSKDQKETHRYLEVEIGNEVIADSSAVTQFAI